MGNPETQLRLVNAAEEHFDAHKQPPEHDASEQDALMYQYMVARDAALFFDKQRKKLLEQLTEAHESTIDDAIDAVKASDQGVDGVMIETGDMYTLYMKASAPPRQFQKSQLPYAIKRHIPDATPETIKLIANDCIQAGTPRKTFEVFPKG